MTYSPHFYEAAAGAIPVLLVAAVIELRSEKDAEVTAFTPFLTNFWIVLACLLTATVGEVAAFADLSHEREGSSWWRAATIAGLAVTGVVLATRILARYATKKRERAAIYLLIVVAILGFAQLIVRGYTSKYIPGTHVHW